VQFAIAAYLLYLACTNNSGSSKSFLSTKVDVPDSFTIKMHISYTLLVQITRVAVNRFYLPKWTSQIAHHRDPTAQNVHAREALSRLGTQQD
jgi:poly(3-hydroxyalkanoate) synthetase